MNYIAGQQRNTHINVIRGNNALDEHQNDVDGQDGGSHVPCNTPACMPPSKGPEGVDGLPVSPGFGIGIGDGGEPAR